MVAGLCVCNHQHPHAGSQSPSLLAICARLPACLPTCPPLPQVLVCLEQQAVKSLSEALEGEHAAAAAAQVATLYSEEEEEEEEKVDGGEEEGQKDLGKLSKGSESSPAGVTGDTSVTGGVTSTQRVQGDEGDDVEGRWEEQVREVPPEDVAGTYEDDSSPPTPTAAPSAPSQAVPVAPGENGPRVIKLSTQNSALGSQPPHSQLSKRHSGSPTPAPTNHDAGGKASLIRVAAAKEGSDTEPAPANVRPVGATQAQPSHRDASKGKADRGGSKGEGPDLTKAEKLERKKVRAAAREARRAAAIASRAAAASNDMVRGHVASLLATGPIGTGP